MRFDKVSCRSEPSLMGKRLFEVWGGTAVGPTIEANPPFTNGRMMRNLLDDSLSEAAACIGLC